MCFNENQNVQLLSTNRMHPSVFRFSCKLMPFFLSSLDFELLRITDAVSATQNLPPTLPLPSGYFKANIWSWLSWLIPFLGPTIAFFFILVFRPCLLKYLIQILHSTEYPGSWEISSTNSSHSSSFSGCSILPPSP